MSTFKSPSFVTVDDIENKLIEYNRNASDDIIKSRQIVHLSITVLDVKGILSPYSSFVNILLYYLFFELNL